MTLTLEYVTLDPTAHSAVMFHGVFPSAGEAEEHARALLQDEEGDLQMLACIVDRPGRWLPIVKVDGASDRGVLEYATFSEDVDPPENNTGGRAGSTCKLPGMRRPEPIIVDEHGVPRQAKKTQKKPPKGGGERSFVRPAPTEKKSHCENQRAQMEELLRHPVDEMDYAELREAAAMLVAFRRKLQLLLQRAEGHHSKNVDHIKQLEVDHPEYADSYKANYEAALRESGLRREEVTLFEYLDFE